MELHGDRREVLMGEVRELCRVQRQAVSVLQDS